MYRNFLLHALIWRRETYALRDGEISYPLPQIAKATVSQPLYKVTAVCSRELKHHFRHLQWEAYQTHFRNLTTTPPSDHPATPSYVTPIAAAQDCQSASRPIRNPGETHDSVDNLASMHTAAFLTRTSPAALQSPASQPQDTTLSGHQPCARQLERGEAKASEKPRQCNAW